MWKESRYNYKFDNNGELLLYNFLSGKLMIFNGEARNQVSDFLHNPIEDNIIHKVFSKLEFIVPDHLDEMQKMTSLINELIENKDELSITILLTDQCNFRCKYCCETFGHSKISENSLKEILKFVDNNISRFKRLRVEWFGGEPLLYLNIIEETSRRFIEICNKHKVSYYAGISTNGYFLDDSTFRKLKNMHVLAYQVTLDGMQETHDQQRPLANGSGSWLTIINNLKSIRDNVKSSTVEVLIRTNITKAIYNNIDEYINFLSTEFGNSNKFSFIWKLAEYWGNIDKSVIESFCGEKEYKKVIKKSNNTGLRNLFSKSTLIPGSRMCDIGKKNALIFFADGSVGKCERNEAPEMTHIGHVNDLNSRSEYYLSQHFKFDVGENCYICNKYPVCMAKPCPFADKECGLEMVDFNFMLETIQYADDSIIRISQITELL